MHIKRAISHSHMKPSQLVLFEFKSSPSYVKHTIDNNCPDENEAISSVQNITAKRSIGERKFELIGNTRERLIAVTVSQL